MSSLDASVYLLVIAYPLLFVVMAVFMGLTYLCEEYFLETEEAGFPSGRGLRGGRKSFILYLCENNSLLGGRNERNIQQKQIRLAADECP